MVMLALITEEGFLISLCYSLELCIQTGISSFSPLPLASLLFSAIFKTPPRPAPNNHFAFLHFFFLGVVLITSPCTMSQIPTHSSTGTLSIRWITWIYLSLPLHSCKGSDLGHTWMVNTNHWMVEWFSLLSSI